MGLSKAKKKPPYCTEITQFLPARVRQGSAPASDGNLQIQQSEEVTSVCRQMAKMACYGKWRSASNHGRANWYVMENSE